jgi:hypothetical protein
MDTPYSYRYLHDSTTGTWRILSPSGHLLYESRWQVHVTRVCQRLNGHFAKPRRLTDATDGCRNGCLQPALLA